MAWTIGRGGYFKGFGWLVPTLVALISPSSLGQAAPASPTAARIKRQVIVSVPDRKLVVMENGAVVRVFPVAVGATVSPSPSGAFEIVRRLTDPTYYHAGVVIPPGQDNPLGPRWIGLNLKGYGIHGTNAPQSVGKAASHGCIRLRNRDIVQLFAMVSVGDTVEIHGERDEVIAGIFGGEPNVESTVARAQAASAGAAGGQ